MPVLDLIIFDCDGVLVDSERISNRVFVDALGEVGVAASLEDMFEYFVGHSLSQCVDLVHQHYGYKMDNRFLDRYKSRRDAALKSELQAVDGVRQVLEKLRVPFCVASNSEGIKVREMLSITGLRRCFGENIYSAADLGKPKPAPDVYLYAASQYGVDPAHCLVIEDTHIGAGAAVAAGIPVYGYAALTPPARLLKAGALRTFYTMHELPGILHDAFPGSSLPA